MAHVASHKPISWSRLTSFLARFVPSIFGDPRRTRSRWMTNGVRTIGADALGLSFVAITQHLQPADETDPQRHQNHRDEFAGADHAGALTVDSVAARRATQQGSMFVEQVSQTTSVSFSIIDIVMSSSGPIAWAIAT